MRCCDRSAQVPRTRPRMKERRETPERDLLPLGRLDGSIVGVGFVMGVLAGLGGVQGPDCEGRFKGQEMLGESD